MYYTLPFPLLNFVRRGPGFCCCFFCAVAEEAARDWEVRLVRWEWDLGLGPGPVLMCECSVDALQAGSFGTLHAVHHTLKHDFQPGFYWVFFF